MWIVKLGGSLATAETLPLWLEALSGQGGIEARDWAHREVNHE